MGGALVLGCSGDTTGNAPLTAPAALFWQVQLNYNAINLALVAPYDTVRLVATPLDAAGHTMANTGPVTFHSADSTVTVDSTGLVTAHFPASLSSPTYVTATVTVNGVTHRDTAWVQVVRATDPHTPLKTFSVQPVDGDSAKVAWGIIRSLPTLAIDSTGSVMVDNINGVSNLLVNFVSGDTTTAKFLCSHCGIIGTVAVGSVTFYAATYAYGVAAQDSLKFVVGYPITVFTDFGEPGNQQAICGDTVGVAGGIWHLVGAGPDSIYVGAGGKVRLGNSSFCPVDVPAADTLRLVFDDTGVVTHATNGAQVSSTGDTLIIPNGLTTATVTGRIGAFHWHIDQYGGLRGAIIIRP